MNLKNRLLHKLGPGTLLIYHDNIIIIYSNIAERRETGKEYISNPNS